ncbi:MAG: UDP-glucose/GDP-mannose dehydrogenase family protein [Rhodospirillaceae bacterium]|jgi:UDPglucose 6-dehydrogenase|nr:UDP-glucose/GDP-mannose dehydrogenase family protein [Rhodospirillaceae bacterium]MBT5192665.1 UDP-glucose/GDP-mannose dehydrogenase family protein [Rhodospirillaceae bacterium]MBT5896460.1 UDP-glucose/GDP-mannose dehydrogenase family protein [Rhodospirillaceae bacterium]MBT6430631.1 UDP-glucose/GDP-mannose dehydrogenase family protein [Rhodospirillaceae bacterium]MBT7758857.1 UDP-glucose/GDP-mannose dehydrogenase family protein [Rhodospirillaceae bacterium]
MESITVIGLWHQGIVGAACLADAGCKVIAADADIETIKSLRAGTSPIFEPGLDELLAAGIASGNLSFSDNLSEAVALSDIVMVMFDTPVDDDDTVILDPVIDTLAKIAPALKKQAHLHLTCQVPVGTTRGIKAQLSKLGRDDLSFSYSPENLQLGKALDTFQHPRLPMIGADDGEAFERIKNIYLKFHDEWEFVKIETAEMAKHALNTYLALSVCFGNELGTICDEVGADGHKIAMALRGEPRFGPRAMILPGLAFAGGTLARDVQTLRRIAKGAALDVPMFNAIMTSNGDHNQIVVRKMAAALGTLADRKVTVLGLTYKPDTSTLRRSAAVEMVQTLEAGGARVTSTDPMADEDEVAAAGLLGFSRDVEAAVAQSAAIVLMTPWQQYKDLDFDRIKTLMGPDPLVVDPFNFWDQAKLASLGFRYQCIGKGGT